MAEPLVLELADLEATIALGHRLGARLFPGAVLGLIGTLGAGKTHLVRALAEGLGIRNSRVVNSPTFVLIQEYQARLPIYHFDTYRLRSSDEFADLGVSEYLAGDGVCLIEWADKVVPVLPADRLDVYLEITGPSSRRVTLTARGPAHEPLLQALTEGGMAWNS